MQLLDFDLPDNLLPKKFNQCHQMVCTLLVQHQTSIDYYVQGRSQRNFDGGARPEPYKKQAHVHVRHYKNCERCMHTAYN